MKKKIIITATAVVITAVLISGVTVLASSLGNEPTEMPEIVTPTKRVISEQEQTEARQFLVEEESSLYTELYAEMENDEKYSVSDPENSFSNDLKQMELGADVCSEIKHVQLRIIIEIVSNAGYCDSDLHNPGIGQRDFNEDMDKFCDFVIACCNTLNDQNVELTALETVRLQDYICDKYYVLMGGLGLEETEKTIETCNLIRETLGNDPIYG